MATSELGSEEESGPSLPWEVSRGPTAADEDSGVAEDEEDSLVWRLCKILIRDKERTDDVGMLTIKKVEQEGKKGKGQRLSPVLVFVTTTTDSSATEYGGCS